MTLLPVKLPLQIKTEIDVKSDLDPKFTQVKVKSEPMDTDEGPKPKMVGEDEKPKVFHNKQATRPVTCTDLFANPAKSGKASIYIHFSADLTKGSFGHFSSFYVIIILKTSKISIFSMFLQESQLVTQSKTQTFLIKLSDMYNVCCHGNSCAYGLHTSCKTGYLISNAFVNMGCAHLRYFCSLCNSIHTKVTETQNILEMLLLASL